MTPVSGSSRAGGAADVTVGVDIGTTSVKALAVDAGGAVVARVRVPHRVVTEAADRLEHDARRAWRSGPARAYRILTQEMADGGRPVRGVCVSAMVPSMTAVNRRGVPLTPGLLYGDVRGRHGRDPGHGDATTGVMHDAEGFLAWSVEQAPRAAGYWPAQAVASRAIAGTAVIDTAMTAALGSLHSFGRWDRDVLASLGASEAHMPAVAPMGQAAGTVAGSDTVLCGGTVDALCDQLVAGASAVGDVLVIVGATLVVWAVVDTWLEVPGLWTVPHTVADRVLVGGPSNAGAFFVDWALDLVDRRAHAPGLRTVATTPDVAEPRRRAGAPARVPVFLPYLRGERVPFHDAGLRATLAGLDVTMGPDDVARAAYESSGFVVRHLLDRAGIEGRRIVASGGGTRVGAWMAAMADATGLPVHTVGVPEGAALGAAFLARMATGAASSIDEAAAWASTGRVVNPDPEWRQAADRRYRQFLDLSPAPPTGA